MLFLYELEELLLIDDINNRAEDGVFIMFHRKSDDYPLAVNPDKWASYQNSGEIAEGVMVAEGGKILVVAPTEATLYWSSAAVSAGGKTTTDRELRRLRTANVTRKVMRRAFARPTSE